MNGDSSDIEHDKKFLLLASAKTEAKEFSLLLAANVVGYVQKKRLVDGLKALLAQVEEVENKVFLVKNLGKAKGKVEPSEQLLIDTYGSVDLKEKMQLVNHELQAMIDEGRIFIEDKPQVHEQLLARRASAKASEKVKLVEKIENMLSAVAKSEPKAMPLPDLEDIYPVYLELKDTERLEKRQSKSLSDEDHATLSKKPELLKELQEWSAKSRMWFELEHEFRPRLEKGLDDLKKHKAEQKKRDEEEALEQKRLAEEQALDKKRLALQQAEERRAAELEAKLEAKRLEAAAKPQKALPQVEKKKKVTRTKLDPHELFVPPPRHDDEDASESLPPDLQDDASAMESVAKASPSLSPDASPSAGTSQPSAPVSPMAKPLPSPTLGPSKLEKKTNTPVKEVSKKPVVESKWQAPVAIIPPETITSDVEEEDNPSLADAIKAVGASNISKKGPAPQPKKKEKKKFTKISASELGFDCDNPNL